MSPENILNYLNSPFLQVSIHICMCYIHLLYKQNIFNTYTQILNDKKLKLY